VQCNDGGNDRVYGLQDTITISFNQNTSVSPGTSWNTSQVLSNLNPNVGNGLGAGLLGIWPSADRVIITVRNATGVNTFMTCSQLRFRVSASLNLQDTLRRSAPSTSESTVSMTNGTFAISQQQGSLNSCR